MTNIAPIVPSDKLEKHSILTLGIRIFTVPILNMLPGSFIKKIMRRSSRDASDVIASSGSTQSLEVMYKRSFQKSSKWTLKYMANTFWHTVVSQPKALRNRLKITKSAIDHNVLSIISNPSEQHATNPIRILSIAGGSSRSTIQVVADLKNNGVTHEIEVFTIDKDQAALDIGKQLAMDAGVSSNFNWICGNANRVGTLIHDKRFDIIEIVGLIDYFDDERTIRLMKVARDVLYKGGIIVAANVMPNSEVPFVHKMGWPKMIYRTHKDLEMLLEKSGFTKTEIITEPLKVHCIAIAKNECS